MCVVGSRQSEVSAVTRVSLLPFLGVAYGGHFDDAV